MLMGTQRPKRIAGRLLKKPFHAILSCEEITEVQLINVNSKMRKIEIIFKAKKAHLPLGENIIFSKDIDSLDLQYFMRLCRI